MEGFITGLAGESDPLRARKDKTHCSDSGFFICRCERRLFLFAVTRPDGF